MAATTWSSLTTGPGPPMALGFIIDCETIPYPSNHETNTPRLPALPQFMSAGALAPIADLTDEIDPMPDSRQSSSQTLFGKPIGQTIRFRGIKEIHTRIKSGAHRGEGRLFVPCPAEGCGRSLQTREVKDIVDPVEFDGLIQRLKESEQQKPFEELFVPRCPTKGRRIPTSSNRWNRSNSH